MAVINTAQKVKLTVVPDGAVNESTFSYSVAGELGHIPHVNLVPVEGELAVYAEAISVGVDVVVFEIESTDGSRLGAMVQVEVVEAPPAPATQIVIVEGEPEPL